MLRKPDRPLMALPSCLSTLPAAAPACMPQTAVSGAGRGAVTDVTTSRPICTAAMPAACASSSPAQQRTDRRLQELSGRRQPPYSAAVQLTAGASTSMLLSPSPTGFAGPLARRAASSGPAAGADPTVQDSQRAGQEQEPSWRRPSEPQRPWDQPSDKRRLLLYYSDHYEVVSLAVVRVSCAAHYVNVS